MEQGTAKLDMLHGSIWDKLLRFALPVAATAALGQLFNAADVAVVGNFASGSRTAAVAAVGANGPIINLILGLFIGIALGATVVIANAIGNNDRKSAQNAVHTSMVMAVVGGVIVAIIGELIAGSLLNLLQVPEDVYPLSLLGLCILEDAIATASAIFIILFAGKFVLALFNPDPQVIDIGYSRLLIVFTAYVFSMLYEVMSGYLRGFGISLAPALLVIFGVCGIRILWISFVFPVKRTFSTILYVYPISLATTALLIGIALLVFRPSKRLARQAQNADSASAT